MKKIAILGSSGMIGSGLTRRLTELGYLVTEFNRQGIPVIDSNEVFIFEVKDKVDQKEFNNLLGFDYIINTLGVIRHKIDYSKVDEVENAIVVNGIFPIKLDHYAQEKKLRIIQIGTDCVYSGDKGSYVENQSFDPTDMYGHSKAIGETSLKSTMNLRVSVIGKEQISKIELLEWVLHQEPNGDINGFSNHIWSGVTPLQLAQIIDGIISNEHFRPGTQHLVPSNKVSKFELVKMIAGYKPSINLKIHESVTTKSVDRSLATRSPEINNALWSEAGYDHVPCIQDMLSEYMEWTGIDCSH